MPGEGSALTPALPAALAELEAAQFALRAAEVLAGSLNLRRTLSCTAQLATERFGSWAGVTLLDGAFVRRLDSAGADDFGGAARPQRVRDLDRSISTALHAAATRPQSHPAPVPQALASALGVPPAVADRLAGPPGVLTAVPLPVTTGRAFLAVQSEAEPSLAELAQLAQFAGRAISAASVYQERSALASTLREALLPAPLPVIGGVQLGASYRPAAEALQIGGDFYDVTPRPDGCWSLAVGDVCGKGVDAAVLTGQVRQSLRTAALLTHDPATTLQVVNEALLATDGSTFVTAVYGVLSAAPGHIDIELAVGGHPPCLLLRSSGQVSEVAASGPLVGMIPEVSFGATALRLWPGDTLLLYTDGATEARGPSGMLDLDPLRQALADSAGLSAQSITERLMQLVTDHLQGWPHDDIALLAVRCPADRDR